MGLSVQSIHLWNGTVWSCFWEKPLTPLDIFLAQNLPRKIREVADDINAITIQDKRKANLKYQQRKAAKLPTITIFQPGDLVDTWRPYDSENYHRTQKLIRHWDGPYAVWEHNPKSPYKVSIVLASTFPNNHNFFGFLIFCFSAKGT